jgi:hypothetical protein
MNLFYLYSVIDSLHGLLKAGDDFLSRFLGKRGNSQVEEQICKNLGHSHPQQKGAVCERQGRT